MMKTKAPPRSTLFKLFSALCWAQLAISSAHGFSAKSAFDIYTRLLIEKPLLTKSLTSCGTK